MKVTTHEGGRFAKWAPPVTVTLKNGKQYVRSAAVLKGSQDDPLTRDELIARHYSLICGRMSQEQIQQSIDLPLGLERLPNITELMHLYTFGPRP